MSNSTCVGDVEYWRRLNPQCSITASPWLSAVQPYELGADQAAQLVPKLKHEGFFVTPPVVSPQQLEKLADCITRVVDAGHRATYALLYDEFFHVLQGLERVMEPVLGPDYQLVADEFEAYCIPTSDSARGSPPHRDSLRNERSLGPDGMPNLVNVWIPLTDTTPANSCMYVSARTSGPVLRRGRRRVQNSQPGGGAVAGCSRTACQGRFGVVLEHAFAALGWQKQLV